MGLQGKIIGVELVQKTLTSAPRQLGRGIESAIALSGEAVRAKAMDNLSGPILSPKTGNLRAAIAVRADKAGMNSRTEIGPFNARTGSVLKYAAAHEFGSAAAHTKPVHWLRNSFRQSRDTILRIFNRELAKAVATLRRPGT